MTLNRRDFLVAAGAASAAATLGAEFATTPALAQDHVLSIALAARAPGGLNPQQTGLTGGDNWAISQIFDALVRADDGTFGIKPEDFKPALAESWETSPDAKTWTYKLRKGVKFHKGYGEVSADDVVFTYGRLLDPKTPTSSKATYLNVDKVEAVDPLTVTLKLPDPLFNAAVVVTLPANIMSKKAFTEKGEDGFKFDPIGTGAYQVTKVDPNASVFLEANPDYFQGPAASKNLKITFIADTTARTLAFLSGQVDMMEGARTPGWIPGIKQRAPKTIFDATKPGSFNHLMLNLTKKPLDDIRVRQAFRYAIDNAAIAKAYGDIAVPMVGMIAPQFEGSVKVEDLPPELQYKPDVEKAKKLLADAGFPNGLTIECFTSQREDYAAIMLMIQEQLRKAGINLDMKIIDHATFHNQTAKDLNAVALNSSSYPPVPTQPLLDQLSSKSEVKADGKGGTNYSHYGVAIPGVDDILTQAVGEPDFDKRIALVQQIEKKVLTDLPDMGIITLSYVIARSPRVDLGYDVKSGYAYWPLHRAKYV